MSTKSNDYICPYCGLAAAPLQYHEGASECQLAMLMFTKRLREKLPEIQPFAHCWEMDPWDLTGDGRELYNEIARKIGVPEKPDDD
jgi:hypothetical protein